MTEEERQTILAEITNDEFVLYYYWLGFIGILLCELLCYFGYACGLCLKIIFEVVTAIRLYILYVAALGAFLWCGYLFLSQFTVGTIIVLIFAVAGGLLCDKVRTARKNLWYKIEYKNAVIKENKEKLEKA